MKAFLKNFCLRGLLAAAGGPLVMAVIYLGLGITGAEESISTIKAATDILSVTLLAFLVAGCTTIYQIERLPVGSAALIHGGILYLCYAIIYVLNNWIQKDWSVFLIFTAIFAVGYVLIWGIIYLCIRKKVRTLNQKIHP